MKNKNKNNVQGFPPKRHSGSNNTKLALIICKNLREPKTNVVKIHPKALTEKLYFNFDKNEGDLEFNT